MESARLPRGLASRLKLGLAKFGETVYVTYRGKEGECAAKTKPGKETKSYSIGSHQIYLWARVFKATYRGKPRLGSILLHELVHSCGGTELDAEAYENSLFKGDGATPPDRDDDNDFQEDGYRGVWVRMDPETGDVTDADGRRVIAFRPARGR